MSQFYLARLIGADGGLLASEEIWTGEAQDAAAFTPEVVARDACGFFNSDEHGANPGGCTVQLFGPFMVKTPAHVFKVEDDDRPDAPDFWKVTPVASALTLGDSDMFMTAVDDLVKGDLIDMQSFNPNWGDDYPEAEFELFLIVGIERETADCVRLDFEGANSFGLSPTARVAVQRRDVNATAAGYRVTRSEWAETGGKPGESWIAARNDGERLPDDYGTEAEAWKAAVADYGRDF